MLQLWSICLEKEVIKKGLMNLNNTAFYGVTMSSTRVNKFRERSTHQWKAAFSWNRTAKGLFTFPWGTLSIYCNSDFFLDGFQVTSSYPSCFGLTTKGILVSTVNCLLSPKEPEGCPCLSNFNIYSIRPAKQLLMQYTRYKSFPI